MNKNDLDVGTGLVGAPACGDVMKLQIKVDDAGIITDVKFKTFGCGSAIASSSYMTERVRGLSLDDAGLIKNTEIAKELWYVVLLSLPGRIPRGSLVRRRRTITLPTAYHRSSSTAPCSRKTLLGRLSRTTGLNEQRQAPGPLPLLRPPPPPRLPLRW
jgi:hypothetical protein